MHISVTCAAFMVPSMYRPPSMSHSYPVAHRSSSGRNRLTLWRIASKTDPIRSMNSVPIPNSPTPISTGFVGSPPQNGSVAGSPMVGLFPSPSTPGLLDGLVNDSFDLRSALFSPESEEEEVGGRPDTDSRWGRVMQILDKVSGVWGWLAQPYADPEASSTRTYPGNSSEVRASEDRYRSPRTRYCHMYVRGGGRGQ